MRKIKLTKEELIRLGVTEVTRDGRVFRDGYEMTPHKVTAKHKYGKDKHYWLLCFYDPLVWQKQKEEGKRANGMRTLLLHRVVWTWFNGDTPLDYMDVCHIDDNPDNNCIDNLEVMTHHKNINARKIKNACKYRNYYTVNGLVKENEENN